MTALCAGPGFATNETSIDYDMTRILRENSLLALCTSLAFVSVGSSAVALNWGVDAAIWCLAARSLAPATVMPSKRGEGGAFGVSFFRINPVLFSNTLRKHVSFSSSFDFSIYQMTAKTATA